MMTMFDMDDDDDDDVLMMMVLMMIDDNDVLKKMMMSTFIVEVAGMVVGGPMSATSSWLKNKQTAYFFDLINATFT